MGTWIVGAIVAILVVLALRSIYNNRKKGNNCASGCKSCSKCK